MTSFTSIRPDFETSMTRFMRTVIPKLVCLWHDAFVRDLKKDAETSSA
jgi:hypothetical protein